MFENTNNNYKKLAYYNITYNTNKYLFLVIS